MAESTPESSPPEEEGGPIKPFLEHLEDLRWVILKSLTALVVGMIIAGAATEYILRALEWPLLKAFKTLGINKLPEEFLQSFHPADPFTVVFQVAFVGGSILAAPFILYFIGQFLLPALTQRERRYVGPAFAAGGLLFLTGVLLCYFAILPPALMISFKMSQLLGMQPAWRIQFYLSFVLWLLLGMGLSFEMPVVLLALVKIGVLSARTLRRGWRWAIVGCLTLSAVLTPTGDPFTMCLFGLPLYMLYEVSVWIAYAMERAARRREEAAARGETTPD